MAKHGTAAIPPAQAQQKPKTAKKKSRSPAVQPNIDPRAYEEISFTQDMVDGWEIICTRLPGFFLGRESAGTYIGVSLFVITFTVLWRHYIDPEWPEVLFYAVAEQPMAYVRVAILLYLCRLGWQGRAVI
jgi:hypothetical protein